MAHAVSGGGRALKTLDELKDFNLHSSSQINVGFNVWVSSTNGKMCISNVWMRTFTDLTIINLLPAMCC